MDPLGTAKWARRTAGSLPSIPNVDDKWSTKKQEARRHLLGRGLVERPALFARCEEGDLRRPKRAKAPRLIVFDVDGTLIWPEVWLTEGPPYALEQPDVVSDRVGRQVGIFPAARQSLELIERHPAFRDSIVAFSSRSTEAPWMREVLSLLGLRPDWAWISPEESKGQQIKAIASAAGCTPREALLFDNEAGQCEHALVEAGVLAICCQGGLTASDWNRGMEAFASSRC